jgi:phage protein
MKQTEINELLKNVEQNNAEVERINRQSSEQRGYVKASIGEVKKQIEALNKSGYQIDFKLVDDTTISPETLAQFKAVASQIVRETKQQNDRVGRIVEAVENADYDAIKELTGQDVTAVNYDIKLDNVDSIKVQAKAIADQDESTILTTEATETLEIDTEGGEDVVEPEEVQEPNGVFGGELVFGAVADDVEVSVDDDVEKAEVVDEDDDIVEDDDLEEDDLEEDLNYDIDEDEVVEDDDEVETDEVEQPDDLLVDDLF